MLDALSEFHFIRPVALLLLPLGVAAWWLWSHMQDPLRGWRYQMDPTLMNSLIVGSPFSGGAVSKLTLIGWLVTSVAIAGPTWELEPNPLAQDATPLVILLKADRSMSTSFSSSTSMQVAQMKIVDLAKERNGQPLGLLAYAGSAHWVLPPTRDTQAIAQMASEITPDVMPVAGDRLDLALDEASQLLASSDEVGSILILADSITADLESLQRWRKSHVSDVQVLAIQAYGTQHHESLTPATKILKGTLESLDTEGRDISAIVRRVSTAPKIQRGQRSESWHEAGWWLVPLICFMVLFLFRSEVAED